ncbi:hypothetical protein POTOM_025439 [Populus tomentosa]|uniref:HMA domain-containing protein n=1 Tax=Populus tomentosa TaxID=118781 RepID=A0A8X8CXD5_POPTO|nr:hypothetical protein POTOM_025439 [Populus tomentosa]
MGAEKEGAKAEAEKKPAADAGEKKDEAKVISVYKLDMHCEGCAKKIRHAVKHLEGVEGLKTDCAGNKLTVTGKVDPAKIKPRLEKKTKRKVEILSPQPKKDDGAAAGGGDKKADEKPEKKPEGRKEEAKKPPPESTVVLKVRLHCEHYEGCISKVLKIISKFKGVRSVTVDAAKNLVTVKGTMDVKDLAPYLKEELRIAVEVVPKEKKQTVTGKVDPANIKARLEPQKDDGAAAGGCDKKADEKPDKKSEGKKEEARKPPPESTVVLKVRLHCEHYEGCISKVLKIISKFKGVRSVTVDAAKNLVTVKGTMDVKDLAPYLKEELRIAVEVVPKEKKQTVTGKVDPANIKARLEPEKDDGAAAGGGDKKANEKPDKKSEGKKEEARKPPPESTVVLKFRLHCENCEGCISKVQKIISKIKGVRSVTVDAAKNLVTVKGTMDVKDLAPCLKKELRIAVEVVPPKKEREETNGDGESGPSKNQSQA